MEKSTNKATLVKVGIIALFLVLSIISVILLGQVKINYNISDYLDDSTDTKISLGIMKEEFGLTTDLSVMISGVTADEALAIRSEISNIENVVNVNFNAESTDYYKDGTALFVILLNGSEYSDGVQNALATIENQLDPQYGDRIEYGGTLIEKNALRSAIQNEIMLILAISLCLVAIVMLLTAKSWLEPFVILASAGVAVLLNMGTNAFFGEISYVTNSVAAILQLALSMDYSIILLHKYREEKENNPELSNDSAMVIATKKVIKPISASALTTMAGLLALLFMSFKVGFDIGTVLMKSIVCSAITAVTLLPVFLLLFDKLMSKTGKPALNLKGKLLASISLKANKVILPVAMVIIALCCVLNFQNVFGFTDNSSKNTNISDKFGDSGTLIVLYENCVDAAAKEEILLNKLAEYKKNNGAAVLKSGVSYHNTVGQVFDVEKAARDLNIPMKDAELLFTLYYFTDCSSEIKMDVDTFINFALDLIANDSDAQEYIPEGTSETLELLLSLDGILNDEYTAEEFVETLGELEFVDGGLSEFAVMQMYGLYFYDEIENKKINFRELLEFLLASDYALEYVDADTIDQLNGVFEFYDKLNEMNVELVAPNTEINRTGFKNEVERIKGIFKQLTGEELSLNIEFAGTTINESDIWTKIIAVGYNGKIGYQDMLKKLVNHEGVRKTMQTYFPADSEISLDDIDLIVNNYHLLYNTKNTVDRTLTSNYEYDEIIPVFGDLLKEIDTLSTVFGGLLDVEFEVPSLDELTLKDTDIQQLYIMYFNDKGNVIPNGKISAKEFINFIIETAKTNETIKNQLPEDLDLEFLLTDADALKAFLSDSTTYDYSAMYKRVESFVNGIESVDVQVSLTESALMGLYLKYAMAEDLIELGEISATDLLEFVVDASENNPLLADKIDDQMKQTMVDSQSAIEHATKLLVSDNYTRILLTVDLPVEGEESTEFVDYLIGEVKTIFGKGAYVAGEMATTNDLQKAFEYDNKLISIFTVVSIFIIIMVVFRSISLPVILVAIIQGAIWIAMSMSLLGEPMFFMSYIMTMCILMGATIDYGILLSTNYINLRATMNKKDAIREAINSSLPTIFTSGVILMISGFVVGLIASQKSISSVGFLLCRGTLVSTIMITTVLPSVLYLLDKLVLKLTWKATAKEEEEN